jgi:prepilin-type N-terminal cleavage/methylation domain-containing protein
MNIGQTRSRGFTLVEIAVVLVIVGLIITGSTFLINSQIQSARIKSVMTQISDLTSAVADFKERFKFLPGDFPAASEIASVPAACRIGGANAGNGNGSISATEATCVQEHLSGAGLIKSGAAGLASDFGGIRLIANSASTVGANPATKLPDSTTNVIELYNLPCGVALAVDTALDDGNLEKGKIRASVASCTPKGTNDPVPALARGL